MLETRKVIKKIDDVWGAFQTCEGSVSTGDCLLAALSALHYWFGISGARLLYLGHSL